MDYLLSECHRAVMNFQGSQTALFETQTHYIQSKILKWYFYVKRYIFFFKSIIITKQGFILLAVKLR